MKLLDSALVLHPKWFWHVLKQDIEKLEWTQREIIKVLETMLGNNQLEKMKLLSLMKGRSREDLAVSFRNFSVVVEKKKKISFILIFLKDNNPPYVQN